MFVIYAPKVERDFKPQDIFEHSGNLFDLTDNTQQKIVLIVCGLCDVEPQRVVIPVCKLRELERGKVYGRFVAAVVNLQIKRIDNGRRERGRVAIRANHYPGNHARLVLQKLAKANGRRCGFVEHVMTRDNRRVKFDRTRID